MATKKITLNELRHLVKKIIKEEKVGDEYNKAIRLFNLAKETENVNIKEYEKLYYEMTKGSSPDIDMALKHFKNAEDFANYIVNKRDKTGEYVFPSVKNKSQAEMEDEMKYRKSIYGKKK